MDAIEINGKRRYLRCAGCGEWRPWRGSLIFTHAGVQFELPICSDACSLAVDPYDAALQPIPARVAAMLAALEPMAAG